MIKNIVQLFYNLSKKHKLVNHFIYDNLSKVLGIGNERMLSVILEEPLLISNKTIESGTNTVSLNLDILGSIHIFDNIDIKKPSNEVVQDLCYSVGLNYIAKIRDMYNNGEHNMYISDFNAITLNRFGDNESYGIRFTLTMIVPNEIYFCDLDNHFDESGEFVIDNFLPNIDSDKPQSCNETFEYKLPKIKLK